MTASRSTDAPRRHASGNATIETFTREQVMRYDLLRQCAGPGGHAVARHVLSLVEGTGTSKRNQPVTLPAFQCMGIIIGVGCGG